MLFLWRLSIFPNYLRNFEATSFRIHLTSPLHPAARSNFPISNSTKQYRGSTRLHEIKILLTRIRMRIFFIFNANHSYQHVPTMLIGNSCTRYRLRAKIPRQAHTLSSSMQFALFRVGSWIWSRLFVLLVADPKTFRFDLQGVYLKFRKFHSVEDVILVKG